MPAVRFGFFPIGKTETSKMVMINRFSAIAVGVLLTAIVSQVTQVSIVHRTALAEYSVAATASSLLTASTTRSGILDCSLANEQSDGFFDDVPDDQWRTLQEITREHTEDFLFHYRNQTKVRQAPLKPFDLIQPDFSCPFERRIGIPSIGDGPKWICDPHRLKPKSKPKPSSLLVQQQLPQNDKPCLVYSIGSRGDFSFETAIHNASFSGCDIHTFDPDPTYASMAPPFVTYHVWGLKSSYHDPDEGGTRKRRRHRFVQLDESFEFKTIQETVQQLGHINRTVDVFKIDCEGCEFTSYQDWIRSPLFTLRQVLVEVHSQGDVVALFAEFFQQGYVVFHKETNVFAMRKPGRLEYVEFGLLKLSKNFRGEELHRQLDSASAPPVN